MVFLDVPYLESVLEEVVLSELLYLVVEAWMDLIIVFLKIHVVTKENQVPSEIKNYLGS
jgi:hypothetical protein